MHPDIALENIELSNLPKDFAKPEIPQRDELSMNDDDIPEINIVNYYLNFGGKMNSKKTPLIFSMEPTFTAGVWRSPTQVY